MVLQVDSSKMVEELWDTLIVAIIVLVVALFLWMFNPAIVNIITSIDDWQILIGSAIIGMLGSAGYLCLLLYKFMQNDKVFQAICPGGCKIYTRAGRIILYVIMGGAIAAIFQIPENPNFVPVQAFVLGTTWPAIVAQALSGTQKQEKSEIKSDIMEDLKPS